MESKLTKGQKAFIGSTAITPKGGVVTVTDYTGKGRYSVNCSVCCLDEELYPIDSFTTLKENWKKGNIPCACQFSYTPTKEQRSIIYKRLCDKVDYTLIGTKNVGSNYKIIASCNKCIPDSEVFPEGSFIITPDKFKEGKLPCLCSKSPKLSPHQALIVHNRFLSVKFPTLKAVKHLGNNRYEYECGVCSIDTELWGKGSITGLKVVDSLPCGCSKSTRFTREQYELLILRRCSSLGYEFLGFLGEYKGKDTKLKLYNPASGNTWGSTKLISFLNGNKDPAIAVRERAKRTMMSDVELTDRLYSNFNYPEGTVFTRSETTEIINVFCPICSQDKYSKNCEDSSKFSARLGDILSGKKCCRCSSYSFSLEDKELQAREYVTNLQGHYYGWVEGKEGKSVEWICASNHKNKTTMSVFGNNGGCSTCAKGGFKPNSEASFYIVEWYGYGESYLKYGVTNQEVLQRIKQQARKAHLDYNILYTFYNDSGQAVLDVENKVKDLYGRDGVCPKQWLPDGFTETVHNTPENLATLLSLTDNLQ